MNFYDRFSILGELCVCFGLCPERGHSRLKMRQSFFFGCKVTHLFLNCKLLLRKNFRNSKFYDLFRLHGYSSGVTPILIIIGLGVKHIHTGTNSSSLSTHATANCSFAPWLNTRFCPSQYPSQYRREEPHHRLQCLLTHRAVTPRRGSDTAAVAQVTHEESL